MEAVMSYSMTGSIGVTVAAMTVVLGSAQAQREPFCVDLVAETVSSVGRVCVTERGDSLFVRFESDGAWRLVETHLAIAPSVDEIPQGAGRHPIMGRFPYKTTHSRGVSEFAYGISNADAPRGSTGLLVIAAHAEVVRGGQNEGAWGKGLAFTDGGIPATYFVYQRSDSSLSAASYRRQRARVSPQRPG
jgi:hypothetical protein